MQVSTSIMGQDGSIQDRVRADDSLVHLNKPEGEEIFYSASQEAAPEPAEEEESSVDDKDAGLQDAVRDEQEYVRQRLLEELKREPSEEEIDEWLREHTEGY
jgi:hypothetical protein